MISKILVAMDGSESSIRAYEYASFLAKKCDATLLIININEQSVKGRKSGRDIPRPVWFVHEDNTLYLLPNYGSDTNWYKNFLANQTLKISVSDEELPA
jgi:nucleotide-binding universal stress UspA family protein